MGMDFIGTTAVIGVLIPIFAMLIGLIIALFSIQRSYKNRQLEHELRMKALEKGYDIPAMPPDKEKKPAYPFTWPFMFLGFGIALICIYLFADGDESSLGFGFVILFIGAGLFASRFYGVRKDEISEAERAAQSTWSAPPKTVEQPKPSTEVASEFPKDEEKS